MPRGASEVLGGKKKKGKISYPPDHKPGMAVPKGGSSCATCEYYRGRMRCGNQFFIAWRGSDKIPAKSADEYCSDWYEQVKNEDELPSYEDGGIVKETGPAIVHKGEKVIPAKKPKTNIEVGPDITPDREGAAKQGERDQEKVNNPFQFDERLKARRTKVA